MTTEVEKHVGESDALWIVVAAIAYVAMGLIGGFLLATSCLLPIAAAFGLIAFAGYAMKGEEGLNVPKWERARQERSREEGVKHVRKLQDLGYLPNDLKIDDAA